MKDNPPRPSLPFTFPQMLNIDLDTLTTNTSSYQSSMGFGPAETVSFSTEAKNAGIILRNILDKNPLKQPRSKFPVHSYFKARARSNSPNRSNLTLLPKNYSFFPYHSPVIPQREPSPVQSFGAFTGIEIKEEIEEDDDLQVMKEKYRKMLDESD